MLGTPKYLHIPALGVKQDDAASLRNKAAPLWDGLVFRRPLVDCTYTLTTGNITSREGVGLYALAAFTPRWHHIIHECLRIRRGAHGRSLHGNALTRRRDALAFMAMAIDGARDIPRAATGVGASIDFSSQ